MRLYDTILLMKKALILFMISTLTLLTENLYVKQIKVLDECTHMVEPLTIDSLGIKGAKVRDIEAQKAIRACEKSIKKHPNDPHVQFLLARAYSQGTPNELRNIFPKSLTLGLPELHDVVPQEDKAYPLIKRSCQNGDLGGCTLLGYYAHTGRYNKLYSSKKTYLLWLWSCSLGDPKACHNLSVIAKNGLYVPKDLKKDYLYSFEGCLSGMYPRACEVLEDQMALHHYPLDQDTRQYIYYKACVSGSNNACYRLEKFLHADENDQNLTKFHYAIKLSCNNGNAKSCEKLGELYRRLPKNRVNNLLAYTFYADGCNNGALYRACWLAGFYKIFPNEGIEQDIDLGISLWEKSCYTGNNTFACYDLARFFIDTDNKKYKNTKNAVKPLEYACQHNNGHAVALGCELGIEICCKNNR